MSSNVASVFNPPQSAAPADIAQVLGQFTRPRRAEAGPAERELLAAAHRSALLHRGRRLMMWTWGTGPRVLLVHGWDSRGSHLGGFVQPLLAAGFQVIAFDAPAHGDSEGTLTNVVDMGDAILQVENRVGALAGLIAHSVGSPATLHAFAQGLRVRASVHIAGPASLARVAARYAALAGLAAERLPELHRQLEAHLGTSIASMELDALRVGFRHPALLLHDVGDREVPYSESVALNTAWPGSTLVRQDGLGHRRIVSEPAVVQRAVEFLATSTVNQAL